MGGGTNNSSQGSTSNSSSRIVWYTPSGKSYHYDKNMRTLSRSKTILQTTLGEALKSTHSDHLVMFVFINKKNKSVNLCKLMDKAAESSLINSYYLQNRLLLKYDGKIDINLLI